MRVHSILFVAARKAVAMAGGVTVRSRHGVLPWLTNGWNAAGAVCRPYARTLAPRDNVRITNGREMVHRPKNSRPMPNRVSTFARGRLASRHPAAHSFSRSARMRAPVRGRQKALRKLKELPQRRRLSRGRDWTGRLR